VTKAEILKDAGAVELPAAPALEPGDLDGVPVVVKKPYSAAGTARSVSRALKKAGFLMADTSDRFRWTEGVHVSRVGYSNLVSVDYHVPNSHRVQADREKMRTERAKVRAWLKAQGYPLNDVGYIVCETD
jgi:hypothetical protein